MFSIFILSLSPFFYRNPMFEGNQQQDAHELLIALLTTLRDIKTPSPTPLTSLGGRLEENEDNLIEHSGGNFTKKSEKKKHKKLFQSSSNGHNSSNSSSHHSSSNSGVRLLSATSKSENGLHGNLFPASTNGTETNFGGSSSNGGNGSQSTQTLQQEQSDSESLPNFVRDNFVGKTVFRTKCLECETSTYRSDKFINIDIPLTFDDDLSETMSNGLLSDDNSSNSLRSTGHGGGGGHGHGSNTLSVADLFLKQIMASE